MRWLPLIAALFVARRSLAQSGPPVEGASELIAPLGARTIAMGEAGAASAEGADAIWWNPALIARARREVALTAASKTLVIDTDIGATAIFPVPRVGAFALSLRYFNFGEQAAATDPSIQSGTFFTSSTIAAATFAAPFGNRLAVGLSYKLLNAQHVSCTGACNIPGGSPQTTALDFGGAYRITKDTSVAIGVALRNSGLRLQVNDAPQADPLPTRFEAGVLVTPKLAQLPPEARVHVAADIITRVNTSGGPGYRFGTEVSWRGRFFARGGYIVHGPDGGTGTSFGVGFSTGKLQIDFAQTANTAGLDTPPSFLSLRYIF